MIKLFLFACASTMIVSCGVMQQLAGIIVDSKTKKPVAGVKVKRPEYNYEGWSDMNGCFGYYRYGSGQPITLQLEKEGYKNTSLTFKGTRARIVQLDSINAQPGAAIQMPEKEILAWILVGDPKFKIDSVNRISKHDFNILIDSCVNILQTKAFNKISVQEHRNIMRCYNTVWNRIIKSDRMNLFLKTVYGKKYLDDLYHKYYVREQDIGFNAEYYAKLKMQLYGGRRKWGYAYYKITKKR